MGKVCRGYNGRVFNADMVVEFVFFFQAPEYGDSLLDAWFADIYGLETPLKGGIFFYIFAKLVEGCGANQRSSPLARAGFSIFDASTDPWAPPAPTIVWSSSMKRMTAPAASPISFRTAFSLSSNSPLNFVPARSAPRSRESTRLFFRVSGISPLMILWARPSTMAVFPTPGSPMMTGLFFVRRERTA